MKYAVISLGGKQFKVTEGQTFKLEHQDVLANDVLFYTDGETTQLGTPMLTDVSVKLSKVEDMLDKKVRVARFKSKSRYKKTKGHRQPISIIKVDSIDVKGEKIEKSEKTENVEVADAPKVAPKAKRATTVKKSKKIESKKA